MSTGSAFAQGEIIVEGTKCEATICTPGFDSNFSTDGLVVETQTGFESDGDFERFTSEDSADTEEHRACALGEAKRAVEAAGGDVDDVGVEYDPSTSFLSASYTMVNVNTGEPIEGRVIISRDFYNPDGNTFKVRVGPIPDEYRDEGECAGESS